MANIVNHEDFTTKAYKFFCDEIKENPRFHRKQWEFFVISREILKYFGTIEGKNGLGFAVGEEILLEYFVKKGAKITGTDLDINDANAGDWKNTNQHLSNFNLRGIVDKNIFDNSFTMDYVDMNYIPKKYLKSKFDFIWSSCALEHLGSIKNGLDFIKNSLGCLKSGGIAVHTTEYNLSSEIDHCDHKSSSIYSKNDILILKNELELLGHKVLPINFNRKNNPINNYVDKPNYCNGKSVELCEEIMKNPQNKCHINLLLHNKYISTSIYIVIIKN
jgi:hypothetical protein